MLTLKCRDVGFNCEYVRYVDSEKEIIDNAGENASKVHGISPDDMDSQLIQQTRSLIKST